MHDIDRAMFEAEQSESTFGESEAVFGEEESPFAEAVFGEAESPFGETFEYLESESESYEMDMAGRLLEINSEQELQQFLGDLVSGAARAARGFVSSPTGRALGGLLKDAAKRVLPQAGQIIGNALAPGLGGQVGQRAGQWLGGQLETEGLSAEDRQWELARSIVRLGNDATKQAIAAGPGAPPQQTAAQAVIAAARRQLPGLVPWLDQKLGGSGTNASAGTGRSGRWVRRGNRIVLLNV